MKTYAVRYVRVFSNNYIIVQYSFFLRKERACLMGIAFL